MDKKEFIDKFASSEGMEKRKKEAEKLSRGAVKFDCRKNISFKKDGKDCTIDLCEVCLHPKGVTMNFFEFVTTFKGVDVGELIRDFKSRSESYFELALAEGQLVANLVIPPDPEMIIKLGEYIDDMMKLGDFTVIIYDPDKDRSGACFISREFLESLQADPSFKHMNMRDVFTAFLIEFAEMV